MKVYDKKIFVMGDTHGEWAPASAAYDEMVEKVGEPDLLIQVGDYGYFPSAELKRSDYASDEAYQFALYHTYDRNGLWPKKFNHPCWFIDGNHDNHEALRALEEDENGEVWIKNKNGFSDWRYMRRGESEMGILFAGGALSVDRELRLERKWYWSPLEDLTEEEARKIVDTKRDEDIHTVISHTCPSSFDVLFACNRHWGGENKGEESRRSLQMIMDAYEPYRWFFGHWHKSGRLPMKNGTATLLGICEIGLLEI